MRAPRQGLTLIEVLIALVIFVVLLVAVTQGLLPVFSLTRKSQVQAEANHRAERALNLLRAAWRDPTKYQEGCVDAALPPHVEVAIEVLDDAGSPTGTQSFSQPCPGPAPIPAPAKRVTIQAKDARGQVWAILVYDIRGPPR